MAEEDYDYLLKVIAVGDGAVGKTALTIRYTQGTFKDDYKMTIGVDFSLKMVETDGIRSKLQVWDTGGQEQFAYVRPLYYKGSLGGIVVFDKTNRQSFLNVPRWFKEVYDNCSNTIPLILVGNKIDLPDIQVTTEEAEELAKEFNTVYFEASAKSGKSVKDIFETLTRMIIDPKYADNLKNAGVDYEKSQIIHNKAYEEYNTYANRAIESFQLGNKLEALNNLKSALHWANEGDFEDGKRWCEDQIVYIAQLLNVPMPEEINGIVLACPACNKYYTVRNDGDYVCPKCYSGLIKLTTDLIKV
ncbi:MAG: GTP-binding protein [Candidatus Helarchaeota archaeon]